MEPEGSLQHSQVPATQPCHLLIVTKKILQSLRQKSLLHIIIIIVITYHLYTGYLQLCT